MNVTTKSIVGEKVGMTQVWDEQNRAIPVTVVRVSPVRVVQIKTPDLGSIHNTIEAVLYCKANGMGACLGGTANETIKSLYFLTKNNLFVSVTWQEPHMTRDKALEYVKALSFAKIEALVTK